MVVCPSLSAMLQSSLSRSLINPGVFILILAIFAFSSLSTATAAIDASFYPPPGKVPSTDSLLASTWLKALDLSAAPTINLTKPGQECPSPPDPTVCNYACTGCTSLGMQRDITGCPEVNVWGLTFNDGPSSKGTPELLDVLKETDGGVKATFFLTGSQVVENPDVVLRQAQEGHHLASLTWSRTPLTTLTNAQIVVEVRWTERAIEDITGQKVRYIRPPKGDIDNRVRFVLNKMGYIVIEWSGPEFDLKVDEASPDQTLTHFKETLYTYKNPPSPSTPNLQQGFITIAHDTSSETSAITKQLLTTGLQSGLKIQSVATCLQDNWPYASPPPAPGNLAGLPLPPPDANGGSLSPSMGGAPPSGHVDYNDYFTMEGQLLNKLIAQAKGRGLPSGSSGSSLVFGAADGETWRLRWAVLGGMVTGLIMF
ncbi:chitin deacetylase [Linnemannia zychae]|nr:chitin deacetylase [Linnemannia zychae]